MDNATSMIATAQDGASWGDAVNGIAAKDMDETAYEAACCTSNGVTYY